MKRIFPSFLTLISFLLGFTSLHGQFLNEKIVPIENGVEYQWQSDPNFTYFFQQSNDLVNWTFFPEIRAGITGPDSYPAHPVGFSQGPYKFFRMAAFPGAPADVETADFDNDGLTNQQELSATASNQTNPFLIDTDSDGEGDWQEFVQGTEGNNPASQEGPLVLDLHQSTSSCLSFSLPNPNPAEQLSLSLEDPNSDSIVYNYTGSHQPNGPAYNWIDISTTGQLLDFQTDPAAIASQTLAFDFPFYNETYNELFISLRGFLTTIDPGANAGAPLGLLDPLPNTTAHAGLIAPYMTIFSLGSQGEVRFQEFPANSGQTAHAVVSWTNILLEFPDGNGGFIPVLHDFQAVLHEGGQIEFNYQSIPPVVGNSFGVTFLTGVQNPLQDSGTTIHRYNSAQGTPEGFFFPPLAPISLLLEPEAGSLSWLEVSPNQVTGQNLDWKLTFSTDSTPPGTFGPARLTIKSVSDGTQRYARDIYMNVLSPPASGDDTLNGTIGDDLNLNGLAGNDSLFGGEGNDQLFGGPDNDRLEGGPGIDELDGGLGEDRYIINKGEGPDIIQERGLLSGDIVELNGIFWEDLSFTALSPLVYQVSCQGQLLLTLEREFENRAYSTLAFNDGLQAVWNPDLDAYELVLNLAEGAAIDTNNNGIEDRYERFVFGALDDSLNGNDSNSNQIPDWWENHFLGGLVAASADFDLDGLDNFAEWQNFTNPTLPDTDGDGLTDGQEVTSTNTNPLISDADFSDEDNDGLLFFEEAIAGTSVNNPDTDGDSISDGDEVAAGTNPLEASSKPFDPNDFMGPSITDVNCLPYGQVGVVNFQDSVTNYNLGFIIQSSNIEPLRTFLEVSETNSPNPIGTISTASDVLPVSYGFPFTGRENVVTELSSRFSNTVPTYSNFEPAFIPDCGDENETTSCLQVFAENYISIRDPDTNGRTYRLPLGSSSWAESFGGSDAVGPRYRKVSLNGRPLPDEQPQQEGETSSYFEQSYVDAFSLNFHHDTSFIHVPLAASDLLLETNANAQETQWNHRGGLYPNERFTDPFLSLIHI